MYDMNIQEICATEWYQMVFECNLEKVTESTWVAENIGS